MMQNINQSLSTVVLVLALMALETTTAISHFIVSTKTSEPTNDDGEIQFLVGGAYTPKQDHHKGSSTKQIDTKTYTTMFEPTRLKLCIDGNDGWAYVCITINGVSIFNGVNLLDTKACKEYSIPPYVFLAATGYAHVVAKTGGDTWNKRRYPVDIYFLKFGSVVYWRQFFRTSEISQQFDETYNLYGDVKPNQVRFCLDGDSDDRWGLSTLVVNGQSITANHEFNVNTKCRDYWIPDPLSFKTNTPITSPTAAPTISPPTSSPTTTPTVHTTISPTIPPIASPTISPVSLTSPPTSSSTAALTGHHTTSMPPTGSPPVTLSPTDPPTVPPSITVTTSSTLPPTSTPTQNIVSGSASNGQLLLSPAFVAISITAIMIISCAIFFGLRHRQTRPPPTVLSRDLALQNMTYDSQA